MQTLHGQHVKLKSYAVIVKCLSMNLIPFTDALPVSGYHTGISGIKIPPLFVCHVFPHPPWFQSRPRLLPTLSSVPGSPSRSSTNGGDYFTLEELERTRVPTSLYARENPPKCSSKAEIASLLGEMKAVGVGLLSQWCFSSTYVAVSFTSIEPCLVSGISPGVSPGVSPGISPGISPGPLWSSKACVHSCWRHTWD